MRINPAVVGSMPVGSTCVRSTQKSNPSTCIAGSKYEVDGPEVGTDASVCVESGSCIGPSTETPDDPVMPILAKPAFMMAGSLSIGLSSRLNSPSERPHFNLMLSVKAMRIPKFTNPHGYHGLPKSLRYFL